MRMRLPGSLHRLLFGRPPDDELDEEIEFHLQEEVDVARRAGASATAARAQALRGLGAPKALIKEECRDSWGRTLLDDVCRDLLVAARMLGRARLFYGSAVLTLSIGIAGATTMFALVQGILLRPLPVKDEQRLVLSWRTPPTGLATHLPYRATDIEEIARASTLFESVTGVGYNGAFDVTWSDGDTAFVARTAAVMARFFAVAGVRPALGRGLNDDDGHEGSARVVVLSHNAWRRLFGESPGVLGRPLRSRGHAFTVVGVMPADFDHPRGVEMWTTLAALAGTETNGGFRTGLLRDVELFGRLRPSVSVEQVAAELSAMMSRLDAQAPATSGTAGFRPVVQSYKKAVVGDFDTALLLLFGAVILMLAVATANLANLLLMRSEARRAEFVVRASLGARRVHVIRHVMAESLIVAVLAGGVALLASRGALYTITLLVPGGLPRSSSIRVDGVVILFAVTITFVTAMLAGLLPALGVTRLDLMAGLRGAGRGLVDAQSRMGRNALVVGQVALTLTLVTSAGLLIRSLGRLQSADMGFAHDSIVFAELDIPGDSYADQERRRQFLESVRERLSAVPGVRAVTPVSVLPFSGTTGWDVPRFTAEGQAAEQIAQNPALNLEAVDSDYFATFVVPMRRGRSFMPSDTGDGQLVAIVSEDVARHAWPRQEAVGKRLKMGGLSSRNPWLTVVGVAAVTRYRELASPRPTLYVPVEQFMNTATKMAIRTTTDLSLLTSAIHESVRSVDSNVRVLRVAPYSEYLEKPLAWPRFNTLLLQVFAIAALLLSCVGLYGVVAGSVRQRYAELGVRMALGATKGQIGRLVLTEGLRLSSIGLVVGLAITLSVSRVLKNLLFEVSPLDPLAVIAAVIALVAGSVAVSLVPARRAMKIEPQSLLRRI